MKKSQRKKKNQRKIIYKNNESLKEITHLQNQSHKCCRGIYLKNTKMIHSLCPCSHAGWNTNRDHAGMKGQSDSIVPNYVTHKV